MVWKQSSPSFCFQIKFTSVTMLINLFLITGTSASVCYGIWGEVPCPNAAEPEDGVEGPTGSLQ